MFARLTDRGSHHTEGELNIIDSWLILSRAVFGPYLYSSDYGQCLQNALGCSHQKCLLGWQELRPAQGCLWASLLAWWVAHLTRLGYDLQRLGDVEGLNGVL